MDCSFSHAAVHFMSLYPWKHSKVTSQTITLTDVVLNQEYALVITTNGGLWRYLLGDTIRFRFTKTFQNKSYW